MWCAFPNRHTSGVCQFSLFFKTAEKGRDCWGGQLKGGGGTQTFKSVDILLTRVKSKQETRTENKGRVPTAAPRRMEAVVGNLSVHTTHKQDQRIFQARSKDLQANLLPRSV